MQTYTEVTIEGYIIGNIWWPYGETFEKPVSISNRHYPFSLDDPPTLREMVLRVTNDGDFQSASLADDSAVIFRRVRETASGTKIQRMRIMAAGQFASIADCVAVAERRLTESEGSEHERR